MNPENALIEYFTDEVGEKSTVTCEADSSKSLAGKSFVFSVLDEDGAEVTYQPFYKIDGDEADPTDGEQEVTLITNRADDGADLKSTYFIINDGPSTDEDNYYGYFTVDGAGYDPKLGEFEITLIKLVKDTAGNLEGTYFSIYTGADQQYYVWFALDADSVDPNPGAIGTEYGIRVPYTTGDSAHKIVSLVVQMINEKHPTLFSASHKHNTTHSVAQITTITAVADVSSNLNNTYFTFAIPGVSGTGIKEQTPYYCWLNVGAAGTDPAISGMTAAEVAFAEDATATQVAAAIAAVINALDGTGAGNVGAVVTMTHTYKGMCNEAKDGVVWPDMTSTGFAFATTTPGSDPSFVLTNQTTGDCTTAVNGDVPAGTVYTVQTAGVDAIGGLAAVTLLLTIDVAEDDTDTAVAAAMTAAFPTAWSAEQGTDANDHKVTVTHPTKGNPTNAADGDVGGVFDVGITTGVDPSTNVSIPVTIDEDEAAADVATKTETAINAVTKYLATLSVATAALTIENKRKGNATDTADVDTGWASFVKDTEGSATVITNIGQNVAAANYMVWPGLTKTAYIRKIIVAVSDDDCTDAAKFGNITALTTGLNINVCNYDGTVKKKLVGPIKTNLELCALGLCEIQAGTNDTLQVVFDIAEGMGQEIAVSGPLGEYIEVDINDNLNGIAVMYVTAQGHYKE